MNIATATAEDAAAVFDLQRCAYQTEAQLYNDFAIPPLVETLDQLLAAFDSRSFYKAVEDRRVVGAVRALAKEGTCHVERLIVHPDHRRRGIGSALLRHVEAAHPAAVRFELFTGHKSVGNLRLYQRVGYRPFREQPVHERLVLVYLEKRVGGA